MHKVLIITSILPIDNLTHKKDENDILLLTEDKIKAEYADIEFSYLYIQTYANSLLGLFSKRWKEFSKIKKHREITIKDRVVTILPIFQIPKKVFFRNRLIQLSLIFYGKRLKKVIKDFQPTLIHAQNTDSTAYFGKLIKKKYKIPYIATLRGINQFIDTRVKQNIYEANKLIAISPTQQKMLSKITHRKSTLIPHGIEDKFFQTKSDYYKDDTLKLLMIGRLLPLKNISTTIEAIKDFKNITLDIIGDGPERNNLEKTTEKYNLNDKIRFLGKMTHNDIIKVLTDYDLFIMPSYPETLGRVYFEAMASQLPVIASKDTGIDGIIENGKEGFLVNHQSKEEIISIFKKIIQKPSQLQVMGENAQQLVRKYSWKETAKKYYELYANV